MMEQDYLAYLNENFAQTPGQFRSAGDLNGLFGGFRPDGEGVDRVFKPVPDSAAYVERLLKIFKAAPLTSDSSGMWFVIDRPAPAKDAEFEAIGKTLTENLTALAKLMDDADTIDDLAKISRVEISPLLSVKSLRSIEMQGLEEAVQCWTYAVPDRANPAMMLHEAFYSIANDYWLAYYASWPLYQHHCAVDVFQPYFELWRRGRSFSIQGDALCVGARPED